MDEGSMISWISSRRSSAEAVMSAFSHTLDANLCRATEGSTSRTSQSPRDGVTEEDRWVGRTVEHLPAELGDDLPAVVVSSVLQHVLDDWAMESEQRDSQLGQINLQAGKKGGTDRSFRTDRGRGSG